MGELLNTLKNVTPGPPGGGGGGGVSGGGLGGVDFTLENGGPEGVEIRPFLANYVW